jgi:CheY-like chemotaxis protein
VKELTQLLGGTVEAVSTEGKGSLFTVRLPLAPATGRESAQLAIPLLPEMLPLALPGAETRNGAKPLLLLVEDNAEMVAFLSQMLGADYRVTTASNGREGLAVAQRELPDVVISDVMMPRMDGYAFCQSLKTDPLTEHIAVILLTARASQESRLEGLGHKADDYLAKPFVLEELQLRLRNLLDRQEKLRQHYQQQWAGPEGPCPPRSVADAFLQNLYQAIETQLDNSDFNPEALASGASMSVRTLNRKLNVLTGMSAARLIRLYRLKRAVQLLQAGHSVSETAYRVGFDNPSYFATAFKEHYHKTPSEYVSL